MQGICTEDRPEGQAIRSAYYGTAQHKLGPTWDSCFVGHLLLSVQWYSAQGHYSGLCPNTKISLNVYKHIVVEKNLCNQECEYNKWAKNNVIKGRYLK